ADVFVGIIGLRYGATVQGRPDLSYTELEFKAATAAKRPRLILLIKDDAPDLPIVDQPVEHSSRQNAFRQRLQQVGVTVAKVVSPAELEICLYQALMELKAEGPLPQVPQSAELVRP